MRTQRHVSRAFSRVGLTRDRRLLLWAAFTGMALAVIALAFIRPIQWMEHAAVAWLREHPTRAALAIAMLLKDLSEGSKTTSALHALSQTEVLKPSLLLHFLSSKSSAYS